MKKLAYLITSVVAELSAFHFHRTRSAKEVVLIFPKLIAEALAPFLAVFGLVGAGLAFINRAPLAVGAGLFGSVMSGRYVWRVVTSRGNYQAAFGPDAEEQIPPERKATMLVARWTWLLPKPPKPRLLKDIPFWTIPNSDRRLICDIWQPPVNIEPSGLAFIYLHGSGWHYLDKDFGTAHMFRNLAAQGHVIMDVAYRLCPETDWRGMQADAKRAIAWMKSNGDNYGVNPQHIVIAGGSAGGHMALLAAYTSTEQNLCPSDLDGLDLTVCGAVSWYGPTDMCEYDTYAGAKFSTIVGSADTTFSSKMTEWFSRLVGIDTDMPTSWQSGKTVQENMMRSLFGGTYREMPDEYRWASPVTHVGSHCPPTLLLQGADDFIVSPEAVRLMAEKLRLAGVPVVHVEYPHTEHAFDLILPQFSPPAQASLYETERFLAILMAISQRTDLQPSLPSLELFGEKNVAEMVG